MPASPGTSAPDEAGAPGEVAAAATETTTGEPEVRLGASIVTCQPFTVPLALLRKHTVVFAGSGSGKTVLLRRLVEEVALHGVSSIRRRHQQRPRPAGRRLAVPAPALGTRRRGTRRALPARHRGGDLDAKTRDGQASRPQPASWLRSGTRRPDEFRATIDAAVAELMPKTNLGGRKARSGRAVLTQALKDFARRGGGDLRNFLAFLADLLQGPALCETPLLWPPTWPSALTPR